MTTNITRWPYGFGARNDAEVKEIKEFLGISPAGKSLDDYLSGLNKTQLGEWNNYWVTIWTNLKRSDIKDFTYNLYKKYLQTLPVQAPSITPAPAPVTPKVSITPEIVLVWRQLKKNISDEDWLAAASSAVSLLSAKPVAADQQLLMGEVPIGAISPSAFLKDPKGIAKAFASLDATKAGKVIDVWKTTTLGKSLICTLIQTATRSQGVSWIKQALPWIGGVIAVMGTTTFVEFLYEESLQTAGMGVYIAISNKQYATAREALNKAKSVLATATFVYNYLGWIAPYSFNVFKNYAKATQAQYDVYDKVIAAQIGEVSDPSATGKVFNITEANVNIANGTAPNVDKLIAGVLQAPETIVKIRSITDGDTVLALLPNTGIEQSIRLLGIDSPEKGATGYKQSLAWLNSQLLGADVTLQIDPAQAKDKYGRMLAVILKDGVNINLKSVASGMSIYFPYQSNIYVNETAFKEAEASAKASNLGNWALTGAGTITPGAPSTPSTPTTPSVPTEKTKITEKDFFAEMKTFYSGRMYMSKKELESIIAKYDVSDIQTFIDEVYTFYTGRAYLSKLELVDLGAKHGFDVSGLA